MNLIVLKFAICDDIDSVCEYLENFLEKISKQRNIPIEYDTYCSGDEFISVLSTKCYDCIFLDIEIGTTNGIDVSRYLRENLNNNTTEIIYISQHSQYTIDLFDYDPIAFLLKPFDENLLLKAFNKFLKRMGISEEVYIVKTGYDIKRIPLNSILYFESRDHKIKLYSNNGVYVFYDKIENIANKFIDKRFIQIHKSFVVNCSHIKKFCYEEITLDNGLNLPIAQSKRKKVREWLIENFDDEEK